MDYSRIMALFAAGSLVCGGFTAFAADNAKPAEVKPAEVKPLEAKPEPVKPAEDPFNVIPPVLAEIGGQLQQILADKVRVTENLGLRHNDWGGVCRKIGSRHTCPNKLLKG